MSGKPAGIALQEPSHGIYLFGVMPSRIEQQCRSAKLRQVIVETFKRRLAVG